MGLPLPCSDACLLLSLSLSLCSARLRWLESGACSRHSRFLAFCRLLGSPQVARVSSTQLLLRFLAFRLYARLASGGLSLEHAACSRHYLPCVVCSARLRWLESGAPCGCDDLCAQDLILHAVAIPCLLWLLGAVPPLPTPTLTFSLTFILTFSWLFQLTDTPSVWLP